MSGMIRAAAGPAVADMQPGASQSDALQAWLRDVPCYATTRMCQLAGEVTAFAALPARILRRIPRLVTFPVSMH